jgi:Domain of unknown function (DUF222)
MDSNTHSTGPPAGRTDGLAELATAVEELATQDLDGLTDAVRAERVLGLRRLLDRLEGQWLQELAAVDARGAAGADHDQPAPSTAGWLRARLRMGAGAAHRSVRTARALFRGPLAQTATARTDGQLSPAHASVPAVGTQELPAQLTVEAEPVLVEAARRLDPARLRRVIGHLQLVADPDSADRRAERHQQRRGLWLAPTLEGMVALDGRLEPEAGQILLAALEPLARPASAADGRSGGQRRADALAELARRALEAGRLPQTGGVRPQLTVTVELDSLLGRPGALGGEAGWAGPLTPEGCRRLACAGAVTRVLVTRHGAAPDTHPDHLGGDHGHTHPSGHHELGGHQAQDDSCGRHGQLDPGARAVWPNGCGPPPPCSPRSWVGPRPSPWRSAGPPGSSPPPNGPPWPCTTAAVSSPAVTARWPGVRLIIWSTGWMAAPPTWTTWSCCAGPIIGPSMRAAGGWSEALTGGRPPPHPIDPTDDSRPPPDRRGRTPTSSWPGAPGRGCTDAPTSGPTAARRATDLDHVVAVDAARTGARRAARGQAPTRVGLLGG